MRRSIRSIILLSSVLFLLGTVRPSAAHPSAIGCGPYVQTGICGANLHQGDTVPLLVGVPFVWLRTTPNSHSAVVTTVFPSNRPNIRVVGGNESWDGYQNWYYVAPITDLSKAGWVEQASLNTRPNVDIPIPGGHAEWFTPLSARLNSSLRFGWLRRMPSSYAASAATVYPGMLFTVLGTPGASYDGVQWWWYVHLELPSGVVEGWLEQSAIKPSSIAPTPNPPNTSVITTAAAFQVFQNGYMLWTAHDERIYVFYQKTNGTYDLYVVDAYRSLPDNPVADPVPAGLVKPIRGFSRVWGNFPAVRQAIGWALQPEQGYTATVTTTAGTPVYYGPRLQFTLPDGRTIQTFRSYWKF